jgi:hypothetical protein
MLVTKSSYRPSDEPYVACDLFYRRLTDAVEVTVAALRVKFPSFAFAVQADKGCVTVTASMAEIKTFRARLPAVWKALVQGSGSLVLVVPPGVKLSSDGSEFVSAIANEFRTKIASCDTFDDGRKLHVVFKPRRRVQHEAVVQHYAKWCSTQGVEFARLHESIRFCFPLLHGEAFFTSLYFEQAQQRLACPSLAGGFTVCLLPMTLGPDSAWPTFVGALRELSLPDPACATILSGYFEKEAMVLRKHWRREGNKVGLMPVRRLNTGQALHPDELLIGFSQKRAQAVAGAVVSAPALARGFLPSCEPYVACDFFNPGRLTDAVLAALRNEFPSFAFAVQGNKDSVTVAASMSGMSTFRARLPAVAKAFVQGCGSVVAVPKHASIRCCVPLPAAASVHLAKAMQPVERELNVTIERANNEEDVVVSALPRECCTTGDTELFLVCMRTALKEMQLGEPKSVSSLLRTYDKRKARAARKRAAKERRIARRAQLEN